MTSTLRWLLLCDLPCPEYKTINGHGLSSHHVSTTVRFDVREVNKFYSYLLNSLSESFRFNGFFELGGFFLNESLVTNRRMSKFSETSGHVFCRFIPQRRKLIRTSISSTKFPSFSYHEPRGKKICVPNINVREERAVYQKRWLERFPSRVHEFDVKD